MGRHTTLKLIQQVLNKPATSSIVPLRKLSIHSSAQGLFRLPRFLLFSGTFTGRKVQDVFQGGKRIPWPFDPPVKLAVSRNNDFLAAFSLTRSIVDPKSGAKAETEGILQILDSSFSLRTSIRVGDSRIQSCSLSDDGKYIVGAVENKLKVWSAVMGREVTTLDSNGARILLCEFLPSSHLVCAIAEDKTLVIWDVSSRSIKLKTSYYLEYLGGWDEQNIFVPHIRVDNRGKFFALEDRSQITVWDQSSWQQILTVAGTSCAFSNTSDWIAVSNGSQIDLVNLTSGETIYRYNSESETKGGYGCVLSIDPSDQNMVIASGHWVLLFDLKQRKVIQKIRGGYIPYQCCIDASGKYFAVLAGFVEKDTQREGEWLETSYLFRIDTRSEQKPQDKRRASKKRPNIQIKLQTVWRENERIDGYHLDGQTIISWKRNSLVCRDFKSAKLMSSLSMKSYIRHVTVAPNQEYILVDTGDGLVIVDGKTWQVRSHSSYTSSINYVIDSSGEHIASVVEDEVQIWNYRTGTVLHRLIGHSGIIECCTGIPELRKLVSSASDDTCTIWDAQSGHHARTFHCYYLFDCQLSRSGNELICLSHNEIKCWDVETGNELWHAQGGERLAISSADNNCYYVLHQYHKTGDWSGYYSTEVRCLDIQSGDILGSLELDEDVYCEALKCSTDGKQLVLAGSTVKVRDDLEGVVTDTGVVLLLSSTIL